MQSNLVSPPTTPQYGANLHQAFPPPKFGSLDCMPGPFGGFLHYNNHDTNQMSMSDEALISPHVSSFPSQIHMPQPLYVSPISCGDPDMVSHFGTRNNFQSSSFRAHMQQQQQQQSQQPVSQIREQTVSMSRRQDPPASAPATKTTFVPEFHFHNPGPQPPQQPSQPHKPKNYVFANQTPDDFD
jgi:hypothetical protein